MDDGISASPAIVDGKLIIGTQKGTLYCLEGE
ncbi:MAG: PQQ-binding-like beta-propeller repeat protein [Gemmataceae bacterium]